VKATAQALENDILQKGRKQEVDVGHDDNDQQLAMQEDEEMKFSGVIREPEPQEPEAPRPSNLKSRDQYISEHLKKSWENKQARQQEIKALISSQQGSVGGKKGKEEEKQPKKKQRASKFKLQEVKKTGGGRQEEEKEEAASPLQLESLFDGWNGAKQLETERSLKVEAKEFVPKSKPFVPAAQTQPQAFVPPVT